MPNEMSTSVVAFRRAIRIPARCEPNVFDELDGLEASARAYQLSPRAMTSVMLCAASVRRARLCALRPAMISTTTNDTVIAADNANRVVMGVPERPTWE